MIMKEPSIEEKAKAYDEALEKSKRLYEQGTITESLAYIFPELKKSEDEKIRKDLIIYLRSILSNKKYGDKFIEGWIAWLEKQGSKSNWCHHEVDLSNCSEEYRKAYYDGWYNCSIQHSQCKSDGNDVVKCLINGMKFYYEDNEEATWGTEKFSMRVKDILSWLEKQGQTFTKKDVDDAYLKGVCDAKQELEKQGEQKPANKVEPKFHEGDWVVSPNGVYWHIDKISNNRYEVTSNTGKSSDWNLDTNIYHKFNIQDAEDGDVLVNWNNTVFIFKAIEDETVKFHIAYNEKWNAIKTPSTKLSHLGLPEPQFEFHPTTKEQRDTLFKAMADAGYTFNFEKKELNKIGSKPVEWSEKDETMATNIIIMLKEGASLHFNKKDIAKGVDWLKSIRPQSHWKPSDEQMKAIKWVMDGDSPENWNITLKNLYQDLKKLKG